MGGVALPQYRSIKDVSIKDAEETGYRFSVRVRNKMHNIDVKRNGIVILSRE